MENIKRNVNRTELQGPLSPAAVEQGLAMYKAEQKLKQINIGSTSTNLPANKGVATGETGKVSAELDEVEPIPEQIAKINDTCSLILKSKEK